LPYFALRLTFLQCELPWRESPHWAWVAGCPSWLAAMGQMRAEGSPGPAQCPWPGQGGSKAGVRAGGWEYGNGHNSVPRASPRVASPPAGLQPAP